MGLKVLMLGGRGCGKSSVLAGMYDQLRHGATKDFLTALDVTEYGKGFPLNESVFVSKQLELREALTRQLYTSFILDTNPSHCIWTYTLRMFIRGGFNKYFDVDFIDVPGSMLRNFHYFSNELKGILSQSDVIIVAIDTPYLMEASENVNRAVNCIDMVHFYLADIDSEKEKMVMFVPVKCEKWVKENRISEVVERVKKDYFTSIMMLSAFPRMSVCVLPVETAGNIIFSELKEPYQITINGVTNKCCIISDGLVRLANGTAQHITDADLIITDPNAMIIGSPLFRPHSWFHINPNKNLYEPHSCDQLMLHILSFVKKSLSADFEAHVKEIEKAGLIMYDTESIAYLKKDI